MHQIVDGLLPLAVPIKDIRHLEGNPRRGDVDAVLKSMKKFGQRRPCVVRRDTGEVIAGNHMFAAARRLKWDQIAVLYVDDNETEAKAYALADNRTSELGGFDDDALAAMIMDVMNDDASLLDSTSYTQVDLEELLGDTPDVDTGAEEARPATLTLNDRFMAGPFTVLNSREGDWQNRKGAWIDLGIQSELGRDGKPLTWRMTTPTGHSHGAKPLVALPSVRGEAEEDVHYGSGATSIFDPVLCELVYRWFSPQGGLVLDPMAGGSVRGIVAGMLDRDYVGIDVREIQVDANRVQGQQIVDGVKSIVPEVPEDDMPELTPVQLVDDIWFKREDLYTFAGVRGAKVRTCMKFIQRAKDQGVGVVTAGARQSPQVNFVAQIARRMGVPCRCHVPDGAMTPELVAARGAGAELIQHAAGYNTVIIARAREDAAESGWVEIPYGMESEDAVVYTKPQTANIPLGVKRVVNSVGSGMTLAGILWGLVEDGRIGPGAVNPVEVVGVYVGGALPVDRLDKWAPPGWQDMVEAVKAPSDYQDPASDCMFGDIQLDPYYEAKCLPYLEPGDLLWVSAIRPSAVPADARTPIWLTGDARELCAKPDLLHGRKADLIFSCPPYGDLEVYSDDPADLSTMKHKEFIAAYRDIIRYAGEHLNDNRFAAVLVGDFRDGEGMYRNFVSDTIAAFEDAGMKLYNEAVLVTNLASLVLRVGKQFDNSRKLGKTHQNLLIFVKGDPLLATEACGPVVSADLSLPE